MLYKAGAVDRLGSVDAKTSISDFTPDEQEKRSSIYSSYLNCVWGDVQMFFTDTPGYGEFVGEMISSFRSCGFALLVADGVEGIEVGFTRGWKYSKQFLLPKLIAVNRLDREMADFDAVLEQLQETYGALVCVPMTIPVGKENSIDRVIHVLHTPDSEIPAELKDTVEKYRSQIMDAVAETDEALTEKYLAGEKLTPEETVTGLHAAVKSGALAPVYACVSGKDVGVKELMDGIAEMMPNPLERVRKTDDGNQMVPKSDGPAAAFVFKSALDPFIGQMAYIRVLTGTIKSNSDIYNLNTQSKERIGQLLLLNGKTQIPVDEVCPGCICGVAKLKATKTGDGLQRYSGSTIQEGLCSQTFDSARFSKNSEWGRFTYPHNNGINATFADGHAEWKAKNIIDGNNELSLAETTPTKF